ncbi:MAG: hypothetical protein IIZ19_05170, partial [Clostridia bacterium]|nr:hypothetical protein [Clostridia bacterium]
SAKEKTGKTQIIIAMTVRILKSIFVIRFIRTPRFLKTLYEQGCFGYEDAVGTEIQARFFKDTRIIVFV